jgi:hypothetical protein
LPGFHPARCFDTVPQGEGEYRDEARRERGPACRHNPRAQRDVRAGDAGMTAETSLTAGALVKAKLLTREDIVAAISAQLNGRTVIPLTEDYVLVMPEWGDLPSYARETIVSTLLSAAVRPTKPAASAGGG